MLFKPEYMHYTMLVGFIIIPTVPWMPQVFSLASGEQRQSEQSWSARDFFATRLRRFTAQFCHPKQEKNLWHPGYIYLPCLIYNYLDHNHI